MSPNMGAVIPITFSGKRCESIDYLEASAALTRPTPAAIAEPVAAKSTGSPLRRLIAALATATTIESNPKMVVCISVLGVRAM